MSEQHVGSESTQSEPRPDVFTKVSQAFQVEDRDWSTVNRRVATRVLAGGGVALAMLAGGMAGFRAAYASKIYPNVSIGDVNVGGMTRDEAIAAVQARVDELNTSTVSYVYQNHTWTPTLAEIGVTVNIDDLVDQAFDLGRDDKAADRLASTTDLLMSSNVVPLHFTINQGALHTWFDTVDTDIDNPAINATFTVQGASLIITDDFTGVVADRDAVVAQLDDALISLERIKTDLPTMVDQPRITKQDLKDNEQEVLNILSNSVTVRFEGKRWEILPEEISGYMIFHSSIESGQLTTKVDFDRLGLATYLRERFVSEVNRSPVNSQVQFYNSQLTATTNSQDGKALKVSEFVDLVAASFMGDHARVDVPVATTRAKVREDNLSELGIKERISRSDSNYQANLGTNRAHNVETGIRLINNTIVAPGDDFSFNATVGDIDNNPEFVDGHGIVGGVITDEFGGGICQVVTTVFRAAIRAGFPITEWHAHTYRLKGYELDGWGPGFDASILQNWWQEPDIWPDLRFTNNTDHFILVSSWADNGIHVVEIYGTDPGFDVQISGTSTWEVPPSEENQWNVQNDLPAGHTEISAWPLDGYGAQFTRTVYDAKGEFMYDRTFASQYKSRGFQCTCSPDMDGIPCW
ncbi:MAG: VanW family protein [Thermomicrobiales bacterium]|nr:VanW family protein [Thermomicrobiales bacterium]MCO5228299.1 VanW family protein [Thermomicrobiales bacterium]